MRLMSFQITGDLSDVISASGCSWPWKCCWSKQAGGLYVQEQQQIIKVEITETNETTKSNLKPWKLWLPCSMLNEQMLKHINIHSCSYTWNLKLCLFSLMNKKYCLVLCTKAVCMWNNKFVWQFHTWTALGIKPRLSDGRVQPRIHVLPHKQYV